MYRSKSLKNIIQGHINKLSHNHGRLTLAMYVKSLWHAHKTRKIRHFIFEAAVI